MIDALIKLRISPDMSDLSLWIQEAVSPPYVPIIIDIEQNFANNLAFGFAIPAVCKPLTT